MALIRIKTWITGEVLTAGDLNSEFDNPINNALSLISPLTGNLDFASNRLLTVGPLIVHVSPEDARTATIDVAAELRSTTSGTPAADIGTGLLFSAESADENPSEVGRLDFAFSDVTAASEDSYADLLLRVAGSALETKYRFASTAGSGFQGTFTHAVTADRTWTLPNSSGTLGFGNIAGVASQTFTSSGTYTKPSGLVAALVVCVGGGGGGGGAAASGANAVGGGGGGGGATSIRMIAAGSIGATETVTIGAAGAAGASTGGTGGTGGTTSFGTLVVAAGGLGGVGAAAGAHQLGGAGGATGSGTGDIKTDGDDGCSSPPGQSDNSVGGNGGASSFGGGGVGGLTDANTESKAGTAGGSFGGGGGGASSDNNGTAAGGAGAAGVIYVLDFT